MSHVHADTVLPDRAVPALRKNSAGGMGRPPGVFGDSGTLGHVIGGSAERFIRRLATVRSFSHDERAALGTLCAVRTAIEAQTDVIVEGDEVTRGYIFEEGWGCRYRLLNDGRRQILNIVVPGDFVGGLGGSMRIADHSVGTLTPCRVHTFPTAALVGLRRRFPALQDVFDWSARRDLAMIQERIVDIGRRTARERLAHLVLELMHRLRLVGLYDGRGFDLPLTQEAMGDALGLSIVHVNRTLRRLNQGGLICYRPGRLDVVDEDGLARIADFDADYLHHSGSSPDANRGVVEAARARFHAPRR